MALSPGTRFGPYEVLGPLGAGGMGEVYRARDTRLSRDAALKILPADVRLDAERIARFEREARTLATLNHANIATLFGLEEADGTQALAMEFVDGQSLSDHLSRPDRRGGLPLAEAISIATQLAVALDAAHEHGVIHRDLKPGNVMVRPDGTVKVLDFGLATQAPDAGTAASAVSSTLTGAGTVLGTPAYMSPEQARGYRVDRRTDIWAFGCVLFELLSGRRAFDGPTASDVVAAVLEHDPDWSQLPASTPPSLRRVLERCLVKDPRGRLRDIGDALHDLESASPDLRSGARPALSLRSWQFTATLLAAALTATWAWVAWRPAPAPAPSEPVRFELAFPQHAPLGAVGGLEIGQLAISPDGSRIVYPTPRGLAVRTRDQLDVTFLDLPGENPNSPFFSPDGRWIGYTAGAALRKVAVSGGPSLPVAETGNAAMGAWGPDSIVYTDQQGMFRVPQDGGRPVTVPLHLADHEQPTFPQVLPGGRVVLFTVIATRSKTPAVSAVNPASRIDSVDLVTGRRTTLVRGGGHQRYLGSGHLLFGTAGSIRAVAFDPLTLELRGTPVEVLRDSGSEYFDVANDGTLIYMRGGATGTVGTLVWVDREGREEPLGAPSMPYIYPRLSPDGRRIALDVGGPNRDIYIWDVARRVLQRFTTDPAEDAVVRWTPDGAKIAFANSRHGVPNVFWQAADGSGAPERVFASPFLHQPLSFAADGTLVVAEVAPGRGIGLKVMTLSMPRRTRPLLENAVNAEVSPDGRWLAYGSTQSGQFEVYVTSYPDAQGRWQISTGGGRHPAWSHDSKEIFYRDFAGALISIPVTLSPTFTAGQGRKLFENSAYRGAGTGISDRTYDVTADARRFLMIRVTEPPQRTLAVVQHWVDDLSRRVPTK